MASRHHIDCIRFLTAVMLTVAVMTSPLRPSHWALGSSHSPKLARNFAIPKTPSARLSANLTALRSVRIKALPSDSEEEKLASAIRPSGWQLDLPARHRRSPAAIRRYPSSIEHLTRSAAESLQGRSLPRKASLTHPYHASCACAGIGSSPRENRGLTLAGSTAAT